MIAATVAAALSSSMAIDVHSTFVSAARLASRMTAATVPALIYDCDDDVASESLYDSGDCCRVDL